MRESGVRLTMLKKPWMAFFNKILSVDQDRARCAGTGSDSPAGVS
jgi:hypothetical protein